MKKTFLVITLLTFLLLSSHAQLGYRYHSEFIELKPDISAPLYIQTEKSNIDVFDKMIGTLPHKALIQRMSENSAIVSRNAEIEKSQFFVSDIYKAAKGGDVIVLPRLMIYLKEDESIETILNAFKGILEYDYNDDGVHKVKCHLKSSTEVLELAEKIYKMGYVKWCEPVMKTNHIPQDTYYSSQFYLKNTGQEGGTAGYDINVEPAWNLTKGSSSIVVAVIDTGVDAYHEDMVGRVLQGYTIDDATGYGAPKNVGTLYTNCKAHGEACAGIIAASHNSIGIRGVASNVKILPVNIFPGVVTYNSDGTVKSAGYTDNSKTAEAIEWAVNHGADILSCSWSGGGYSNAIELAITKARTQGRGNKGCPVVFSAGNGYPATVGFPSNINGVITVGAITNTGNICNYSQTGPSLDLVAPVSNASSSNLVVTTDRMSSLGYDSGNYTVINRFGGTSAACPQVAGVAALLLSVNPNLTESEVRSILRNTATSLSSDTLSYGKGLVNAFAAVSSLLSVTGSSTVGASSEVYSIANLPSGCTVSWTCSGSGSQYVTLQQNSPTANSCTLVRNTGASFAVTLTATITKGGTTITKSKSITLQQTFSGTYQQEACTFHGYSSSAISSKSLQINYPMSVHQGCTVMLQSSYFSGATVTHLGATPDFWYHSGNTVKFSMPYSASYNQMSINVNGIDLYFYGWPPGSNHPINLIITPEGDEFHISLVPNEDYESSGLNNEAIKTKNGSEVLEWTLEVYDAMSGKQILSEKHTGNESVLETSGWKPGIYVVRIIINGQIYSEKISVK